MSVIIESPPAIGGGCSIWARLPNLLSAEEERQAIDFARRWLVAIDSKPPVEIRDDFLKALADPQSAAEIDLDVKAVPSALPAPERSDHEHPEGR